MCIPPTPKPVHRHAVHIYCMANICVCKLFCAGFGPSPIHILVASANKCARQRPQLHFMRSLPRDPTNILVAATSNRDSNDQKTRRS